VKEIVVSTNWRERIEGLLGRRRETWIVAGIAVVLALVSLAVWSRGAPAAVAPPSTTVAVTPAPTGTVAPAGSVIYVHVAGAVRRPGLYELPAGVRAADAIEAAGGAKRHADLDAINLAEVLVDAMKLDVPERGEATAVPTPSSSAAASALVDLNTADQAQLETIPGIGPVTATAILQHRDEIGGFQAIEELLDVDGIGPATLESLRPYVTI
jgi:competence protein ComEA